MIRSADETKGVEYDYVVVTMKSLPDLVDVSKIIRPGESFASIPDNITMVD